MMRGTRRSRLGWLRACALCALLSAGLSPSFSPAPAWAEKGDKPQFKPSGESGDLGDLGNPFGLFGDDPLKNKKLPPIKKR